MKTKEIFFKIFQNKLSLRVSYSFILDLKCCILHLGRLDMFNKVNLPETRARKK